LEAWLVLVRDANAKWKHPPDMLKSFPSADPVTVKSGKTVYVFNIRHNEYRLICAVHFNLAKVFALRFYEPQRVSERSMEKRVIAG